VARERRREEAVRLVQEPDQLLLARLQQAPEEADHVQVRPEHRVPLALEVVLEAELLREGGGEQRVEALLRGQLGGAQLLEVGQGPAPSQLSRSLRAL